MESHKFDKKDHDDSDQYSSSESCNNIAKCVKIKRRNFKEKAVSSSANRNRRESKIQQKFRELSSFVPGSNKNDGGSMISDAISYLKSLEERTSILEEQTKNTIIAKAWVFGDNDIGESTFAKQTFPEIEAKAQGKDILIRVHCENKKGYLTKVLGEIEKLHLNVDQNISSMAFGDSFLDITIMSEMKDGFSMTLEDLKRELREALQ